MITVFGITNCTTVKKTCKWLETNKIEYIFWDYKKVGIDKQHLEKWCNKFGWETVLNRSGLMWKKADEKDKVKVVDTAAAIEFMLQTPTSIKRPIIEYQTEILKGFDEAQYERELLK